MFLSKDFLDEPADGSWGNMPMQGMSSSGTFGQSSSTGMRHRQAPSPLGASNGFEGARGEDDIEATPTSAASLRQKMLQQRQRALQKQRTTQTMSTGVVMANESMPSAEAPPTPANNSRSNAAPSRPGSSPVGGGSSMDNPPASSSSYPMLDQAMRRLSMDEDAMNEEDASGVVMPDPAYEQVSKEEEARRRSTLAQELDERGICHVFDPSPLPNGPRESYFDIANIAPHDMKNFILDPAPKNAGMIECRIIRERSGLNKLFPKYTLESDSGIFLLTAKKQKNNKTSNYAISMSKTDTGAKESEAFLGKLRSNFLGLEFTAYGTGLNPKKIDPGMSQVHAMQLARQELVAVQYSSSFWGSKPRGPRKMGAVIPHVQPSGERLLCRTLNPDTEGLLALQKNGNSSHLIDVYQNKPPKWNEQIGAFVLNFNKRVTQASVKNFQLTCNEDPDTVYLQFGRVGKDVFNMDFRFPFSPFQAFAICLSSFDYKLCCE
uniref:Tubby C-terminal domain-containing protein n=1 Tax=Alexandrium monilatum TaxID=311494 RepID=A0A7S4SH78_9DINO|mmetsp:Transcript_74352/g.231778  ORF Transcript_74352/g.231778 Transcript_74352/m.231778 type:complete len:491 (+) Transcript_74352:98-1570(+)